ncbi:MAG: hypothetical protein HSCHL_0213 [Hydrogenibacillus schlegelii]|uniref:Uncharacterized protein n=1 Tax=Hydrogenibacillus schlegelii TaxID=1484 RepID=A0A2T5G3K9_HYDSH|nr:MAG: hypothetical protein HSCHL_0213 [Hydrogenibacillus schlegelii]
MDLIHQPFRERRNKHEAFSFFLGVFFVWFYVVRYYQFPNFYIR